MNLRKSTIFANLALIAFLLGLLWMQSKQMTQVLTQKELLKRQLSEYIDQTEHIKLQQHKMIEHLAKLEAEAAKAVNHVEKSGLSMIAWALQDQGLDVLKIQPEDYLASEGVTASDYEEIHMSESSNGFDPSGMLKRVGQGLEQQVLNLRKLGDTFQSGQAVANLIPSILPAKGRVSSQFGYRKSPFHGGRTKHNGIDIAAPAGTKVYAAADGLVVYAGRYGSYGRLVILDHGFSVQTRYAHNQKLLVKVGDTVHKGQQISTIGMTGRTTGAHLHYEVLVGNQHVNPKRFIKDGLPSSRLLAKIDQLRSKASYQLEPLSHQVNLDPSIWPSWNNLPNSDLTKVLFEVGKPDQFHVYAILPAMIFFVALSFSKIINFFKNIGFNGVAVIEFFIRRREQEQQEPVADYWGKDERPAASKQDDNVVAMDEFKESHRKVS